MEDNEDNKIVTKVPEVHEEKNNYNLYESKLTSQLLNVDGRCFAV